MSLGSGAVPAWVWLCKCSPALGYSGVRAPDKMPERANPDCPYHGEKAND